ncbi:MAG: STAS-like domain-containing protein [bacterium]
MIEIRIPPGVGGFVEDKDLGKNLRTEKIIPALLDGQTVVLDFSDVKYATQSFIHALVGEAFKRFGQDALDRIEFRKCSQQLKSVIELVVAYSFTNFLQNSSVKMDRAVE